MHSITCPVQTAVSLTCAFLRDVSTAWMSSNLSKLTLCFSSSRSRSTCTRSTWSVYSCWQSCCCEVTWVSRARQRQTMSATDKQLSTGSQRPHHCCCEVTWVSRAHQRHTMSVTHKTRSAAVNTRPATSRLCEIPWHIHNSLRLSIHAALSTSSRYSSQCFKYMTNVITKVQSHLISR